MSSERQTHLEGIHQVIDEEEAPQLPDSAIHMAQHDVAVLLDELLRHGHIRVQVSPAEDSQETSHKSAANSSYVLDTVSTEPPFCAIEKETSQCEECWKDRTELTYIILSKPFFFSLLFTQSPASGKKGEWAKTRKKNPTKAIYPFLPLEGPCGVAIKL